MDCVVEDRLADDWLVVPEVPAAAVVLPVVAVLAVLVVFAGLAVLALVTASVMAVIRSVWLRARDCWSR